MLKADVGVGKKIRFAIGGPQQLLRHRAGCDQARDTAGCSPAHPLKDDVPSDLPLPLKERDDEH